MKFEVEFIITKLKTGKGGAEAPLVALSTPLYQGVGVLVYIRNAVFNLVTMVS